MLDVFDMYIHAMSFVVPRHKMQIVKIQGTPRRHEEDTLLLKATEMFETSKSFNQSNLRILINFDSDLTQLDGPHILFGACTLSAHEKRKRIRVLILTLSSCVICLCICLYNLKFSDTRFQKKQERCESQPLYLIRKHSKLAKNRIKKFQK